MSLFDNVPDSYTLWQRREAERERSEALWPTCDRCRDPVEDDFYFEINGEIICKDCLNRYFRKAV